MHCIYKLFKRTTFSLPIVDFLIDFWHFIKYNLHECINVQNFFFCENDYVMSRLTLLTSKVQQLITQHEALSVLVELDATCILLNCGYGVLQDTR
jgi:hypothetical protein